MKSKEKGVIIKCGSCDSEFGWLGDNWFYFDKSKIKGKKPPHFGKYWSRCQGDITIECRCGNKVKLPNIPVQE